MLMELTEREIDILMDGLTLLHTKAESLATPNTHSEYRDELKDLRDKLKWEIND